MTRYYPHKTSVPIFDLGPKWVKDGSILSQARSRSKGPLSDKVADAQDACGQSRSWVDKSRTIDVSGTTGIGVTSPSGRVSVKDPSPPKLQSCRRALVNGIHPIERRSGDLTSTNVGNHLHQRWPWKWEGPLCFLATSSASFCCN